jgi:hypothetical protein
MCRCSSIAGASRVSLACCFHTYAPSAVDAVWRSVAGAAAHLRTISAWLSLLAGYCSIGAGAADSAAEDTAAAAAAAAAIDVGKQLTTSTAAAATTELC